MHYDETSFWLSESESIIGSMNRSDMYTKSMSNVHSLVCNVCWTGPFSQQSFRTLVNGTKVTYKTTWSQVQQSADYGCGLCSLLITDKENHKDDVCFHLRFASIGPNPSQEVTPLHAQYLIIAIEGYEIEISDNAYYLYTTCGTFLLVFFY